MSYFDNFDNEFLNKYKKILKKIIDVFFSFRLIIIQISLSFDSPSKTVKLESL
jgi:hypothetical protein